MRRAPCYVCRVDLINDLRAAAAAAAAGAAACTGTGYWAVCH